MKRKIRDILDASKKCRTPRIKSMNNRIIRLTAENEAALKENYPDLVAGVGIGYAANRLLAKALGLNPPDLPQKRMVEGAQKGSLKSAQKRKMIF